MLRRNETEQIDGEMMCRRWRMIHEAGDTRRKGDKTGTRVPAKGSFQRLGALPSCSGRMGHAQNQCPTRQPCSAECEQVGPDAASMPNRRTPLMEQEEQITGGEWGVRDILGRPGSGYTAETVSRTRNQVKKATRTNKRWSRLSKSVRKGLIHLVAMKAVEWSRARDM